MSKHIGAYSSLHGPGGKVLTDYTEQNIPSLWNIIPERILNVASSATQYTGFIPGWTTTNPLTYTENKLFFFSPHVDNLASPSLSLNGLPLLPILRPSNRSPIPAGTLVAGGEYLLWIRDNAFELLSNILGLYEPISGTFTPSLVDVNGGRATLSIALGGYMQSGRQIFCYGQIVAEDTSMLAGQLAITDLPFTASFSPAGAARTSAAISYWNGLSLPATSFGVVGFLEDINRIRLYHSLPTSGRTPINAGHILGTLAFYFDCHYRAA